MLLNRARRYAAGMRVLVVDDDPKFRGYISNGLVESGIDCRVAADGNEARDSRQIDMGRLARAFASDAALKYNQRLAKDEVRRL